MAGMLASEERRQHSIQSERNMMNSIIQDMKKCMSPEDVQQILDADPRPCPTAVKMNPVAVEKHMFAKPPITLQEKASHEQALEGMALQMLGVL
eukprot:scaffold228_cov56-Cyclotella_meneghiniana.AAC.5